MDIKQALLGGNRYFQATMSNARALKATDFWGDDVEIPQY